LPTGQHLNHLYYGSGHLHQLNLDGQLISDMDCDDLHREVLRTQGKLTRCFGYDAIDWSRFYATDLTVDSGLGKGRVLLWEQSLRRSQPTNLASLARGM